MSVVIGKVVVDVEKLSEESQEAVYGFEADGQLTDAVIAALVEWNVVSGEGSKGRDGEGESKSSKIRRMAKAGMSTGDISRALDLRFQFVYNVIQKEGMKKAG